MYNVTKMTYLLLVSIVLMCSLSLTTSYAQFGTTSVSNWGIVSPLATSPWSFGTTSVYSPSTSPFFTGYSPFFSPYLGGSLAGIYPGLGGLSPYSNVGIGLDYSSLYKAMLYYQYLTYAYQFYLIARSTPMFYMNDMVADYIGSSLYSYANKLSLSPQEAIISFIQQHLL